MILSETVAARFARSYRVDSATGCWEWTKSFGDAGYGQMGIGRQHSGRHSMAGSHRVSWVLHNGAIPPALYVLHRCDNRRCVCPKHLFLGTQLDNIQDMDAKGRRRVVVVPRPGEKHPMVKLSELAVQAIRSDPRAQTTIAADYGVSQTLISKIKRGKRWSHIAPNL